MRRVLVPVLLLAAFGCGRAEWREADANLNAAAQAARADGFVPMAGPHNTFGDFAGRGAVAWRVHLEAHQPYFLAAACTNGCDTLDFDIREPHGGNFAADTSAGPAPRLLFTAPEEGDYRVTFRYGTCGTDRCRWVAQLYDRPASP